MWWELQIWIELKSMFATMKMIRKKYQAKHLSACISIKVLRIFCSLGKMFYSLNACGT